MKMHRTMLQNSDRSRLPLQPNYFPLQPFPVLLQPLSLLHSMSPTHPKQRTFSFSSSSPNHLASSEPSTSNIYSTAGPGFLTPILSFPVPFRSPSVSNPPKNEPTANFFASLRFPRVWASFPSPPPTAASTPSTTFGTSPSIMCSLPTSGSPTWTCGPAVSFRSGFYR